MGIRIRNKNRYIYKIKSLFRRYVYSKHLLLENYLKLKESIIKTKEIQYSGENYRLGGASGLFGKIFIETISYCNNDCAFCPASTKVGAKDPKRFMTENLYIKILNELTELSFKGSIAFFCNNEPLLDNRLVSWVNLARGMLRSNFFYLYTNGLLINLELANQLFAAGLNRIIINNYDDNYELALSLKDIIDNASLLTGEIILNYRLKNEYLLNRAGEAPNARRYLKRPFKIGCQRARNEIVVGSDGTVPLCCADALWKVVMGNVGKESLKEIWFSDSFQGIRGSLLRADRGCTKICKVCDALNFYSAKGTRE